MVLLLTGSSAAGAKPHIISFGKWTPVQWSAGTNGDDKPLTIKVRALMVDARVKEYVVGLPHDVTDRLFVVRRAFRVNDALPEDTAAKWQWQRGGWLLVDRMTGRISSANLPEFDVLYSPATWYRGYVAYCGVSDDGKKIFAIVAELSRRKPVLKKAISRVLPDGAPPDSACAAPVWQRSPTRVTFEATGLEKQTFAIRGHVVDLIDDADEEDEPSK